MAAAKEKGAAKEGLGQALQGLKEKPAKKRKVAQLSDSDGEVDGDGSDEEPPRRGSVKDCDRYVLTSALVPCSNPHNRPRQEAVIDVTVFCRHHAAAVPLRRQHL